MNNKRKIIIWLLIIAGIYLIALLFYNFVKDESSTVNSNIAADEKKATAPDFMVYDYDGNKVKLSDFKGKPIVLNFWASWCPPCKEEMPNFQKAYEEEKDVLFMMVNLTDGQRETKEKAKAFIGGKKYTFPVFYDLDMSAANEYSIYSIPATFLIDRNGVIVKKYSGSIDGNTLKNAISLIK